MGVDYYSVLGLGRDADEAAIKKAYRKAAVKWHPDKHAGASKADQAAAEEKFKVVAEAFDVLSDPTKKSVYDRYGEEGLKAGVGASSDGSYAEEASRRAGSTAGFGGMGGAAPGGGMRYEFRGDPNDMFARFFRGGLERTNSAGEGGFEDVFEMGGFGGLRKKMPVRKRRPVVTVAVGCALEDLYNGTAKKLKITRKSSTLTRPAEKVLQVPIKPGFKGGTKLTFVQEGDEVSPGTAQDVVVVLREKPHPRFVREGADLHYCHKVHLADALCGLDHLDIETLDAMPRILRVNFKGVPILPTTSKLVSGEGMPDSKTGQRGDLVVTFEILFPQKPITDQEKRTMIRAALS